MLSVAAAVSPRCPSRAVVAAAVSSRAMRYSRTHLRRPISTTYLLDTLLQRPNPLLTNLETCLGRHAPSDRNDERDAGLADGDVPQKPFSVDPEHIPKLSNNVVQPFHATAASKQVLGDFRQELEALKNKKEEGVLTAEAFCKEWNRIREPVLALQQTLVLLSSVSEVSKIAEWKRYHQSFVEQQRQIEEENAPWMHQTLLSLGSNNNQKNEIEWAAQHLRVHLEEAYAPHLSLETTKEKKDKYVQLTSGLRETNQMFLKDCETLKLSKTTVGLMYNMIGLTHDKAQLLGFDNHCDQVFAQRMAHKNEVERLHQGLHKAVLDFMESTNQNQQDLGAMGYLLRSSYEQKPRRAQRREDEVEDPLVDDEQSMIRFEQHVTLKGAMNFMNKFLHTVFGVELVQDKVPAWSPEVQLFHVLDARDNHKHLGSFFLDPFERIGKLGRPCVIPIHIAGGSSGSTVPVAAMLLQLELPSWEGDDVSMKWEDMKHLFHEMGHVMQHVLPQSSSSRELGTMTGAHHMPRDALELLPTFMEKWLLEKTTLYGLFAASASSKAKQEEMDFSDESIDAFYRVLSRRKAQEISLQIYLGTLEITLFSGFDLRGKETIMALQQRLAKELAPQEERDSNDLTPLVQVLQLNASNDHVGFYSYLWADAVSAVIFEKVKAAYTQDGTQMPKLSESIRALLLHPGGLVSGEDIRSEWGIGDQVTLQQLLGQYNIK